MVERTSTAQPGPPVGDAMILRGRFGSADKMEDAIEQLLVSGFDRADLSVPNSPSPSANIAPDSGARPADTDEDARQVRTLHSSGAATAAALAAAGITIGTGGAAAPAIAAAVAAGAAAGGATYAVSSAANELGARTPGRRCCTRRVVPVRACARSGEAIGGRVHPPRRRRDADRGGAPCQPIAHPIETRSAGMTRRWKAASRPAIRRRIQASSDREANTRGRGALRRTSATATRAQRARQRTNGTRRRRPMCGRMRCGRPDKG